MLDEKSRDEIGLELARIYFSRKNKKFEYIAFKYAVEHVMHTLLPMTDEQFDEKYGGNIDIDNLDKPMESDRWQYSIDDVEAIISESIEYIEYIQQKHENPIKVVTVNNILESKYQQCDPLDIKEYPPFEVPAYNIPTGFFSAQHYIYRISDQAQNQELLYLRDTNNQFYFERLYPTYETYRENGIEYGYLRDDTSKDFEDLFSFGVYSAERGWTYFLNFENSGFDWSDLSEEAKDFLIASEGLDKPKLHIGYNSG